ncbi:hypothetical protein MBAV_000848 [Candidatus Magnetobacterium bavaricum]|uniref:Uncharacterized protein n=1 Tax=Candidatus Magnetobacterium bavaricum TaxID=29290 RepID=A0A0F3GYK4_9BACT|nr:hypothetical protein MBAV_000848 [Candidatus Magnetobacterium bavaricum]
MTTIMATVIPSKTNSSLVRVGLDTFTLPCVFICPPPLFVHRPKGHAFDALSQSHPPISLS